MSGHGELRAGSRCQQDLPSEAKTQTRDERCGERGAANAPRRKLRGQSGVACLHRRAALKHLKALGAKGHARRRLAHACVCWGSILLKPAASQTQICTLHNKIN